MSRLGLKRKILGIVFLTACAFLLAPFVAVQVQEWMFRYRAGRLLADMRALQLHHADLPEIQAVFMRWNHEDRPRCCWFETDLSLGPWPPGVSGYNYLWFRLFRMYRGHHAYLKAMAAVDGGRVWKNFEIELETSPRPDPLKGVQDNLLSGATTTTPQISIHHVWDGLTLHRHYVVDEARVRHWDPRTPDISVIFDPQADPKDIGRLAGFDLSCVTAIWPCRRPDQLMPEAAAEYSREEPELALARKEHVCSPQIITLMARNAEYAGLVTVTGHKSWGDADVPVVRLDETLKPGSRWNIGQERNLLVFVDDDTTDWGRNLPPEVHPGRHFILLAPISQYEPRSEEVERCGIVPLNPTNLQIVQGAITENLLPTRP